MAYQLKIEKVIERPTNDVFRALQEGRLFVNCGAETNSMKIDFRVGGKYHLDFPNHKVSNFGEFLEIVPNKKLVFSWCQNFGADQKPDTQVTIELFPDGAKTRMVLVHSGFQNKETCDNHEMGWTTGMNDMTGEIQNGRVRIVRAFEAPIEKLFAICKNPDSFFAFMGDLNRGSVDFRVGGKYQVPTKKGEIKGEFLEIVPNKKISLSWLVGCSGPLKGSHVTLTFHQKETGSSMELIHEGLVTEDDQKSHRFGWEMVTAKMSETLRH